MDTLVFPLDVERELRVGDESFDPKLTPLELDSIGAAPIADYCLPPQSLLSLGEVIDADNPAQPATASLRTGANGLTKRCLVGGRVVKDRNDLDKSLMGQRNDDVACSEAGVDTPVDRCHSEFLGEAFRSRRQPIGFGGIRDVVNSHTVIVTPRHTVSLTGVPSTPRSTPIAHLLVNPLLRWRTAS